MATSSRKAERVYSTIYTRVMRETARSTAVRMVFPTPRSPSTLSTEKGNMVIAITKTYSHLEIFCAVVLPPQ